MLKWLKRIGLSLLVIVELLAVWIHIGSIDQESFDDRGLLSELKPVPDSENGFLYIAFLDDKKYKFGDISNKLISDFSKGKKWDIKKVDRLVSENKSLFDAIRQSNAKPQFRLPERIGLNSGVFPYENLIAANRLLIMEARRHVQDFEYDKAIDSIEIAVKFSEHVRLDSKNGLISWSLGLVMQSENLSFLHELYSNYDLPVFVCDRIKKLVGDIKINNYDFSETIYGEYEKNVKDMKNLSSGSMSERLKYFHSAIEVFNSFTVGISFKGKAFLFINTMIPDYYVHKNFVATEYAVIIRDIAKENIYCAKKTEGDPVSSWSFSGVVENPGWVYFLRPNSLGISWLSGDLLATYIKRRCFFYVYADGVKAAVALKIYEKQHGGGLPKKLDMLVPDYLDRLPIDYFDGQPLRYSIENDWLYSVGADYKDDGGALDGFYQGKCDKDKPCFNNPTIPLTAPQAAQ